MDTDFHREKKKLLKKICEDYNLNQEEVFAKYLTTTRKRKSKKEKEEDMSEYIETFTVDYNGVTYLVDANGNVFTYDIESPKVVGMFKQEDKTIQFYR
jgi:hypothetical protein